jgi:hypothetical protein
MRQGPVEQVAEVKTDRLQNELRRATTEAVDEHAAVIGLTHG